MGAAAGAGGVQGGDEVVAPRLVAQAEQAQQHPERIVGEEAQQPLGTGEQLGGLGVVQGQGLAGVPRQPVVGGFGPEGVVLGGGHGAMVPLQGALEAVQPVVQGGVGQGQPVQPVRSSRGTRAWPRGPVER